MYIKCQAYKKKAHILEWLNIFNHGNEDNIVLCWQMQLWLIESSGHCHLKAILSSLLVLMKRHLHCANWVASAKRCLFLLNEKESLYQRNNIGCDEGGKTYTINLSRLFINRCTRQCKSTTRRYQNGVQRLILSYHALFFWYMCPIANWWKQNCMTSCMPLIIFSYQVVSLA